MTRYRTIVADPPWEVERSHGGANWLKGQRDRPTLPYPTMTLEQIKDLAVREMATDDAHLYLWTVQRHLQCAFDEIRECGVRVTTVQEGPARFRYILAELPESRAA